MQGQNSTKTQESFDWSQTKEPSLQTPQNGVSKSVKNPSSKPFEATKLESSFAGKQKEVSISSKFCEIFNAICKEPNFEFAPKQSTQNFDQQICPKPSVTSENPEDLAPKSVSFEEVKTQIFTETRLFECESKIQELWIQQLSLIQELKNYKFESKKLLESKNEKSID